MTEFGATMAPTPITAPSSTTTPAPSQTLLPILTPLLGSPISIPLPDAAMQVPLVIEASRPMLSVPETLMRQNELFRDPRLILM